MTQSFARNEYIKKAIFAGGCFWCIEAAFDYVDGVMATTSGYTGGRNKNPSYDEVSSGSTGHLEAVEVVYDESKVSYEKLLEVFWRNIDPTQGDGQFADRGSQYYTAIFYLDENQKMLAEASKEKLKTSGIYHKPIVTPILSAKEFYPAEDYHQDYHKKNPVHYTLYKRGSGREGYIERTWGEKA